VIVFQFRQKLVCADERVRVLYACVFYQLPVWLQIRAPMPVYLDTFRNWLLPVGQFCRHATLRVVIRTTHCVSGAFRHPPERYDQTKASFSSNNFYANSAKCIL